VAYYYLPKSVSYALPISLLFAASYAFGDLYAKNELIIIFATGIPLRRLGLSLFVLGAAVSIASVQFEDRLVIRSQKAKKSFPADCCASSLANESNIDWRRRRRLVYAVDYYNAAKQSPTAFIVERSPDGSFAGRYGRPQGPWEGGAWNLKTPLVLLRSGLLRSRRLPASGEFRRTQRCSKRTRWKSMN
jgi:lipopolysaccharide export system permease protein